MNDQRMTTPRTAAGQLHVKHWHHVPSTEGGVTITDMDLARSILAIEAEARAYWVKRATEAEDWIAAHPLEVAQAEARAAALEEARAAVEAVPGRLRYDGEGAFVKRSDALAAIDALRERSGDVLMVTAPDFGQQYSTRGAPIRHTTKRERSGE